MWVINKHIARLEFCPIFIPVTSMLMVMFDEKQTYNILNILLQKSYKLLDEDGQVNRAQKLRAMVKIFSQKKLEMVVHIH